MKLPGWLISKITTCILTFFIKYFKKISLGKAALWKTLVYWLSSFWLLDINSYLAFEEKKFQSRKSFKCVREKEFDIFHHLINETQSHKGRKCLSSSDNGFGCEQGHRAPLLRIEA